MDKLDTDIFNEAILEATNPIKQITRLTVAISFKFQMATAHDRTVLNAAIGILTQAMTVATTSPADAQRLYTAALKTASLVHGKYS